MGDGVKKGASAVLSHCGSEEVLNASLRSLKKASKDLLQARASLGAHPNVAIISHYPPSWQDNVSFADMFLDRVPESKKGSTKVFNFFGHYHTQQCVRRGTDGRCLDFLTGGGGGCCGTD